MKILPKLTHLLIVLMLMSSSIAAQNFFKSLPPKPLQTTLVTKAAFVQLDEISMRQYLLTAPMEFKNNGLTIPLDIPLPSGETVSFGMVESPVLSPEVAAQNPDIKTYTGNGMIDKKSVIRISFTKAGFNAILLNVRNDDVYFEKYTGDNASNIYYSYFTKDAVSPNRKDAPHRSCNVNVKKKDLEKANTTKILPAPKPSNNTGATLHTYRLAFAATAEFTAKHGGTAASSLATIVGYVNRMTAIYRNELSVSFTLVSGTNLIYTNSISDPYSNDDESLMVDENQPNLDAVIGNANYDVGHVLGYRADNGSGSGIATTGIVGDNANKAQGASVEGEAPYVQLFFDQVVFHEMGHEFNMTHSYNSSLPVCTTREQATSVEPGSGATLMSYGFTCSDNTGDDDYISGTTTTGPLMNFHTVNYDQAIAYIATIPAVGNNVATGNSPPVVTMPSAYTIPKSTPFALIGSATDINGNTLTYSWEGTNTGLAAAPNASTLADPTKPPFFRSYAPSASASTRTYPILSAILNGSNYAKGEKLPSISFVTKHRLTVRDNTTGGGVSYGNVNVTINGSIGPFLITSNLAGSVAGLSSQTITWSVNGTNTATPNVKISLSTDGGQTFPNILLASTPNDGSQSVTIPNIATAAARIKVEAVGNIFFDISNTSFTITATGGACVNISATQVNVNCFGASTGGIQVLASGGTPPYQYKFDSLTAYGSSAILKPLKAGTYRVKVKDATSCESTSGNIIITQPAAINATFIKTDATCIGKADGTITVTASGGTAPYGYRLGTGGNYSDSNMINGLKAGTYKVYVKDGNGCTGSTASITIGQINVSCFAKSVAADGQQNRPVLTVSVKPNPGKGLFALKVITNNQQPVYLRVCDINGKTRYTATGAAGQSFSFGEAFAPGIYMAEVRQGDIMQTIKVIKM